jgi:hypothetical protein
MVSSITVAAAPQDKHRLFGLALPFNTPSLHEPDAFQYAPVCVKTARNTREIELLVESQRHEFLCNVRGGLIVWAGLAGLFF